MKKIFPLFFVVFSVFSSCTTEKAEIIKAVSDCEALGPNQTREVSVGDNFFSPQVINARVGDTIRWNFNAGTGMPHTTTSDAGNIPSAAAQWDSGVMSTGSFTYILTTAGSYHYVCTIHPPNMTGTINVCE